MFVDDNTPQLRRAAVLPVDATYPGRGDLTVMLNATRAWFHRDSTIVLEGVPVAKVAAQSDAARAAGWNHSKVGAWTLFHTDDGRTVSLGLRDAFAGNQVDALFDRKTPTVEVEKILDRYHRLTGVAWRGTYFTTAMAGIRVSWENVRGGTPLWNVPKVGPGYCNGPLEWSRPLTADESAHGWTYAFDANMAYLGTAVSLDGAWSGYEHTGPQLFDDKLPGYWLVQLEQRTQDLGAHPGRPPLFDRKCVMSGGRVWVTTPYAKLLAQLGDRIEVLDAWTARPTYGRDGTTLIHGPSGRVLRRWAETIRDARAQAEADEDPIIVEAVKRTYKDAMGGLQRDGSRVHRPDWAHMIIDGWRATLYRRILNIHHIHKVWPIAVKVDSITYAHPITDGIAVRPGLGGFKHTVRRAR